MIHGGCLSGAVTFTVEGPMRPVIACHCVCWDGAGENLSIFAGALDQPNGLQGAGHIYCADKGDWYDLPEDGARRAPGHDPELTTMVRE